ncbi:hypothetical protein OPS25_04690 [Alteromonas ponticola]|uniref:Solute-binding protein family 3/N-terminal domain-containing protein n=1 Tax=Alteromonas aquimaris TaxID=2998417 RepID=A0ABT3P4U7_9ALTE|nr:hypothetical protein [Alteromonas aquimaris]MCW8107795.1 hypothetical protein [Alteromonas aquimaris]
MTEISKVKLVKFLLFLCLLPSLNIVAEELEAPPFSIQWAVSPAPPFHILSGSFYRLGMCDVLVDQLTRTLTQVQHSTVVMPHTRIRREIEKNANICFPCLIKRDVSPWYYYSDLTVVHPPLGVITTRKNRNAFKAAGMLKKGRVALRSLIKDDQYFFGKPVARKYPTPLQEIVESVATSRHFFPVTGGDAATRILRQISLGRLGYTLEYPTALRYFSLTQGKNELVFIPTQEYGNRAIPGAIGCTKNAWGKEAVKKINAALKDVVNHPDYLAIQQFWQVR